MLKKSTNWLLNKVGNFKFVGGFVYICSSFVKIKRALLLTSTFGSDTSANNWDWSKYCNWAVNFKAFYHIFIAIFRRFINENQRDLPAFSDRSYIFVSLCLAIISSIMLINYQQMGPLATVGFTIFAMSSVIGVKSIIDLYVKIIGISSLLDTQLRGMHQ